MSRALKVLKIVAVLLAVAYLGDYLSVRFRIPNRELLTTVQIEVYYAVGLKGQKTEYMRADPETVTCVHSLFPQNGCLPCWYVTRHLTKWIEVGCAKWGGPPGPRGSPRTRSWLRPGILLLRQDQKADEGVGRGPGGPPHG
jgi:hypothetical protein